MTQHDTTKKSNKIKTKHDELDSGLEHLHLDLLLPPLSHAPSTPSSSSHLLLVVVGKGVHLAWSGEDALVVGVDVVHDEEDGLAAAPKDLAKELDRAR